MNSTIWFVLGLVIGMAIGRRNAERRAIRASGGQDASHKAVAERKGAAKARVMELFATKTEVSNDDVENMLDISDATATNYLSELESEGKITQIGREGRAVYYKKNG